MTIGSGESLDSLMRTTIHAGWFVPVTPGTRYVTIGGAVGSDVHGKNHHIDGTFGAHVRSLDLVLADGSTATVSRDTDPELFWATIGGMGLTGVVTSAKVAMRPIETSYMSVQTTRIAGLDDLFAAMKAADETATYSVAWVDTLASGAQLGRSVLTTGEHATLKQLPAKLAAAPLQFNPSSRLKAPGFVPSFTLNRYSVRAFNEMWFRKAPASPKLSIEPIATYFHPLDGVGDWNRIYGAPGFVQYQFVVPDDQHDVVRYALEQFARAQCPVFLAVLKRFGAANNAPLSFPTAGWTLAVDIPATVANLSRLLDHLDERVVAAGGRVYLAKDARVRPAVLRTMYPRLNEFEAVRHRVDPSGKFASDMSVRLGL